MVDIIYPRVGIGLTDLTKTDGVTAPLPLQLLRPCPEILTLHTPNARPRRPFKKTPAARFQSNEEKTF